MKSIMKSIMKSLITILLIVLLSNIAYLQSSPIIIDHTCTKIDQVPTEFVEYAKNNFNLSYGHTSHGSQIVTGMSMLAKMQSSIFQFNKGSGTLSLLDGTPSGDLGNPDRTTWAQRTRALLAQNTTINIVMWSWCGQVGGSEYEINLYLSLMDSLEKDFPNIKFVYMTGHLDGSGESGNVNTRNNQIRNYCKNNDKILFDFADIESYNPDGEYFLNKNADDGCNYSGGNWAKEWCEDHPTECPSCGSCAHSHCLNCYQKGKAFWWMMARLAGWNGITSVISPNNFELISYINYNSTVSFNTEGQVTIYDILGNVIIQNNVSTNESISLEKFPYGIYFIQINSHIYKIHKY